MSYMIQKQIKQQYLNDLFQSHLGTRKDLQRSSGCGILWCIHSVKTMGSDHPPSGGSPKLLHEIATSKKWRQEIITYPSWLNMTKLDLVVAALPRWLSGKAKSAGVLQLGFWPLAPSLFSSNHLHAVSASWHCLLNRSQRQRLRRAWWEAQGETPRLLVASQHKSSSRPRCLGKNNSL